MHRGNKTRGQKRPSVYASVLRKGKEAITNEKEARAFLLSLADCDDAVQMVHEVGTSDAALDALRAALSLNPTSSLLQEAIIPLLQVLGKDELAIGARRRFGDKIVMHIFDAPFFILCVAEAVEKRKIRDVMPLAWLLLKAITDCEYMEGYGKTARSQETTTRLAKAICSQLPQGSNVSKQIENVLDGSTSKTAREIDTLEGLNAGAGGRHDNDLVNYRDISIFPTFEEVICAKPPFLPRLCDSVGDEISALDRHFRLLREDFVGPVREELVLLNAIEKKSVKKEDQLMASRLEARIFRKVQLRGIGLDEYNDVSVLLSFPQPPSCVDNWKNWQSLDPKSHEKKYKDYWDRRDRLLQKGSLVAIQMEERFRFATVTRRELSELDTKYAQIGIVFQSEDELFGTLDEVGCGKEYTLIQLSASSFAYKPVLQRLQSLASVPLRNELVLGQSGIEPSYTPSSALQIRKVIQRLHRGLTKVDDLIDGDESQCAAIARALSNRSCADTRPAGYGKVLLWICFG